MNIQYIQKTPKEQQFNYIEKYPIQVFLGGYMQIPKFSIFESFFAKIKGKTKFILQQKQVGIQAYESFEILTMKQQTLSLNDPVSDDIPTMRKLRQFTHIALFDTVYIKKLYSQRIDEQQYQTILNSNIRIQASTWGLKLQFNGIIDEQPIRLQMTFDMPKNKQSEQDFQTIKTNLKDIKDQVQLLYAKGDWTGLFNIATYTDLRITMGGIFIQNYQQKVTFSDSLIYNLVSLYTGKTQFHISALFFLAEEVYQQTVIPQTITKMMLYQVVVSKQIIAKSNKWLDFILSPKFDGIRAMLICRNGVLFLLFESDLQILAQNVDISTFVMIVSVDKDQIYVEDLLYIGHNIINMNMIERIYQVLPLIQIIVAQLGSKLQYYIHQSPYILVTEQMANNQNKLEQAFKNIIKQPYPTQGLKLKTNQPLLYQKIYKWMPIDKMTINFFCQIIDPQLIKQPVDEAFVYIGLFSEISNTDFLYQNIQYNIQAQYENLNRLIIFQDQSLKDVAFVKRSSQQESENPINNKVVEFYFDLSTNTWVMVKIRGDKDPNQKNFGNYFLTAQAVLQSIQEDIQFSQLYNQEYKIEQLVDLSMYKDVRQYSMRIDQLINQTICQQYQIKSVLDMQTHPPEALKDYIELSIKNIVLVIPMAQDALKYKQYFKTITQQAGRSTQLDIENLNIEDKSTANVLLNMAQQYQFQFINCSHVIECMLRNDYIFDVFIRYLGGMYINRNVGQRKVVISCSFQNGKRLFDLLQKTGDIQIFEQQILKYHFQRIQQATSLMNIGSKILAKQPKRQTLSEKYIFNPEYLLQQMNRCGFKCIFRFSFTGEVSHGTLLTNDQIKFIQQQYKALNEQDQFFMSLYDTYIFESN